MDPDKLLRRISLGEDSHLELILAESLALSGREPLYELIEDLELKLTLFAAASGSAHEANQAECVACRW